MSIPEEDYLKFYNACIYTYLFFHISVDIVAFRSRKKMSIAQHVIATTNHQKRTQITTS